MTADRASAAFHRCSRGTHAEVIAVTSLLERFGLTRWSTVRSLLTMMIDDDDYDDDDGDQDDDDGHEDDDDDDDYDSDDDDDADDDDDDDYDDHDDLVEGLVEGLRFWSKTSLPSLLSWLVQRRLLHTPKPSHAQLCWGRQVTAGLLYSHAMGHCPDVSVNASRGIAQWPPIATGVRARLVSLSTVKSLVLV